MTPTQEQLDIVASAKTGINITIQAFSGAAKTTTLTLVANEVIKPSLYLAYNKAMADEARHKFPAHVEVRTSHSLAYAHVGHQYKNKLQRPRGAYRNVCGTGSEIGKYFKISAIELSKDKTLSSAAIGLCIRDIVNKFEHSDDTAISDKHLPFGLINDFKKRKGFVESTFKVMALKYAKRLWELRVDTNSDVLCTHDTYMKVFQLNKPILSGFDVIYLDEAQDTNPCLLDIFARQECQKILVGDKYQSIYQWRGSVDAMNIMKYEERVLTQSFRFGQSVADVATQILKCRDTGEITAKLRGFDKVESSVEIVKDDIQYPYTMLFRTNAELLSNAVTFIKSGIKLNIETDMKDFVKLLSSALSLFQGKNKEVKHEAIVPFSNWNDLITESSSKPELSRVARIIKDGEALEYIAILDKHYNVSEPDITLTTSHKSKGREWDTVVLADDFPSVFDNKGEYIGLDDQERNLIYVAATRAKKKLYYNSTVEGMLTN
jgi:superfamily I DNA/RNA helicase